MSYVTTVSALLWARRAYIGNTLRGENGLHAFGNNSAESESILMKSGTVWLCEPNVAAGPGRFWMRSTH